MVGLREIFPFRLLAANIFRKLYISVMDNIILIWIIN